MSKYSTIFLDLDDTLLVNKKSVSGALETVMNVLGIKYDESVLDCWLNFEIHYWGLWESGKSNFPRENYSKEELIHLVRSNRFIEFFEELHLSMEEAKCLNDLYEDNLDKIVVPTEDLSFLKEIHDSCKIVISTNGPEKAALGKIKALNISPYIDLLIASGACGFNKPMANFYSYIMEHIDEKDKSKIITIGDSISTDVLGGKNFGIDTCWYNPNNKTNKTDIVPTYEIKELKQLIKVIKKES